MKLVSGQVGHLLCLDFQAAAFCTSWSLKGADPSINQCYNRPLCGLDTPSSTEGGDNAPSL